MKENMTILAVTRIEKNTVTTTINTYKAPHLAKEFLEAYFELQRVELKNKYGFEFGLTNETPAGKEPVTLRDIVTKKEGEGDWKLSGGQFTTVYHVCWKTIPGEYNVTDDEVYQCLDAFVNSSRGASDYKAMAQRISESMHRYCQNELWKFVKALIGHFAEGRYDERNKTAHTQAGDIYEFMKENEIA